MRILVIEMTLYAPWVHSLKEKRMELRSITQRIRNKFNVSVCESENQDAHQTLTIGIAAIAPHQAMADSVGEKILRFVEGNTEAEITRIRKEIL